MIPFPIDSRLSWILLGAVIVLTIYTPSPISLNLLSQATFGLIGIFGGIAVAAALVYLAKARDLLNRSIADYDDVRGISAESEKSMRSAMNKSVQETKENILIIICCGFFNYLLLMIAETNIPRFTDAQNLYWSTKFLNVLGSAAIISSLYAVWDTVQVLSVAHELEGEIENSQKSTKHNNSVNGK